jgi:hypothetical protein
VTEIQIYTETNTARLQYACHILFDLVLQIPFKIYEINQDAAWGAGGPMISYSAIPPSNSSGLHIIPAGLLHQSGLEMIDPETVWMDNMPLLFPTNPSGTFGFDIFSAVFFMVARYEEYLPFTPDMFGRFPEYCSTSGQFDFTHLPVVHLWAGLLQKKISTDFPTVNWSVRKAKAIFTYDIDVAYAYRGRTAIQNILSFGNDLLKGNLTNIKRKISSRFGSKADPSDTYIFLENNPLQKIFFFLLAENRTKYDRNISPDSPVLKTLIGRLALTGAKTGIHPSYYSCEKAGLIKSEKGTLENILNKKVEISRQHFLRFRLPETYRQLYATGIRHDYSMQYPEMPGFRAGICLPYPFFDVLANKVTGLIIHPGCIMETTFRDDLNLPAARSLEWFIELWEQVKMVGGEFISIWHNDTLWDGLADENPLAFKQIHEKLIQIISRDLQPENQSLPG